MIPAEIALTFDRVAERSTREEERIHVTLSPEDQTALDYLDSNVESHIYKGFCGEPFDFEIPSTFTTPEVVAQLKCIYEKGGWSVGIIPLRDAGGHVTSVRLIFAALHKTARSAALPSGELAPEEPRVVPRRHKVSSPPRVLLVPDEPGWAFDINARDLATCLEREFHFDFFYVAGFWKGERTIWSDYDIIYELFHRNPAMGIPMDRALGAMRSQFFKPEAPLPPDAEDVRLVNSYRGFQVSALRNYEELKDRCPTVRYLSNPIATDRFNLPSLVPEGEIICEWNGNPLHRSPHGSLIKHYYDIVVPACSFAERTLLSAEYGTVEGPRRKRAPAEMPAFYQHANVAVVASEYESASNSAMEAMASGLALVATDVGNHRELMERQIETFGDTGILLVPGEVNAFVEALGSLTPGRVKEMGEVNRAEIMARWSWDSWKERYADFLRMALP